MPYTFPGPSWRTDRYAYVVDRELAALNMGSGFMVSIGELSSGRLIVTLSGETRANIEDGLEARLRGVPPPYPGFRRCVVEGQSSIHNALLNPYTHRQQFHYGGSRNCSEPKLVEMASILRDGLVAMTTFWHGPEGNKPYRNGYLRYQDNRAPLCPPVPNQAAPKFARPCEVCQANEQRLMVYLEQGFLARGRPRFGSYEAPF